MKYVKHPFTSEVLSVSPLEAKRLLRYGWHQSDAAAHWSYHREVLKAQIERMPRKGEAHRRLQ